ncbi:MAG: recombinase family protein [Oscillospiraceae bacterium]
MKNRVCTLYRVSTDKQVDHNDKNQADIPMQRKACHAFCEKMGWVIVHEEQEEGVSGPKVRAENRDKLQIIKELAKQKKFDILLVFMFDRIGRIADETPFVVEWFVKNGIEVWCTPRGGATLTATQTNSPTTSAFGRLTVKGKRLLSVPKPHWSSSLRVAVSKAALLHTAMTL